MAKIIDSRDIFCYTFNFSGEKDDVKVGENHESIISIRGQVNTSNKFRYDSLRITRNGSQVKFDPRILGSSIYTRFRPSEPGKYLISGILTTSYKYTEWEIHCGFQFHVIAVNK